MTLPNPDPSFLILVVDDTASNRKIVTTFLRHLRYEIDEAADGFSALEYVQNRQPDLILLDIGMPQMDGYETCERIKAIDKLKDVPIIFMTAHSDLQSKLRGFEMGAVDYVTKPLAMQEVAARVRTHLRLSYLQRELNEQNNRLNEELLERQKLTEALQEHNRELDAFSHTVAHDLKSPLTAILGYADLLTEALKNEPDLLTFVNGIQESAGKSNSIIQELLLLASVRKQNAPTQVVWMAQVFKQAKQRVSRVAVDYQGQIEEPAEWPVLVQGYAPWLEEVWVNYLTNALKYGGVPPVVKVGYTIEDDHCVRFWVKDNGAGLNEEQKEVLFREFTRLDQIRAQGHGLGLSIVRRIMDKLGGYAGAESEVGQGSTFYFVLPLYKQ
jgi:signal transduction histidine kinase